MCKFKSGIILKGSVALTPIYNESHSALLRIKGINDTDSNARKVFVRAELIPPKGDILSDVNDWKYNVDQDIVPDWYEDDPAKYENDFREAVKEWRDKEIFDICGVPCTKIKEENGYAYYHICKPLFVTEFGDNNDYRSSSLREKLLDCDFAKSLQKEFGDNLAPTSIDLTSMDGLKDYGFLEGDILSILDINLYRECRENIFCDDWWWWLSTPDSTDSGYSSSGVRFVFDSGRVGWRCSGVCGGVRPFFILKSNTQLKKINEKEERGVSNRIFI